MLSDKFDKSRQTFACKMFVNSDFSGKLRIFNARKFVKNTELCKYAWSEQRVSGTVKRPLRSPFKSRIIDQRGLTVYIVKFCSGKRGIVILGHCSHFQFGLLNERWGCVFITVKAMTTVGRGVA